MPRAPDGAGIERDRKVAMTQTTPQSDSSWLAGEELDAARQRLPILYVDAIPVRVDGQGVVTSVGLLLRVTGEGRIARALVSGRVLYHERVRSALLRHLEKDLGPLALPKVPLAPQPFTIAEYFPTPGVTPFHDPRQHAVSLAYVVPVEGDCAPQQDALELTWFSPREARDERLLAEMTGGQGVLLQQGLAHVGH
jgi:ADP-ribose pyrophosphatase YjhB (NUDIX family)